MCTKFLESIFDTFDVIQWTRFPFKSGYNCKFTITKGHNSMRKVGGDMVLVLCTPSVDGLYLNPNL